jgi:Reverse transcriptase (RNA-dependent DNA polymerase)/Endonuclease-reverse transcriptase
MLINCRSILKNNAKLQQELDIYDPDILVLTETWLNKNVLDSELNINLKEYDIFRRDRVKDVLDTDERNWGGVLIATRKAVQGEEVYSDKDFEFLGVNINLGENIGKLLILGVYRPRDDDNAEVLHYIKNEITDKIQNSYPVIIAGDLNLPTINWEDYRTEQVSEKQRNVGELLTDGFTQVVKEGTRMTQLGHMNLLDVVLIKPENLWMDTEVIKGFSDHDIPIVTLSYPATKNETQERKIFNYNRADQVGIMTRLEERLKDFIMLPGNINEKWQLYKEIMTEIQKDFIPEKTMRENRDPAYYNKEVKTLKRKARRIYNKYKRNKKKTSELENVRNELEEAKSRALDSYLTEIMDENNQKKSWNKMYTHIRNAGETGKQIPTLKCNGKTHILDTEKAEVLGQQYEKVYQQKESNTATTQRLQTSGNFTFDEKRLMRIILELDGKKAAGPDGITGRLIKLAPIQQCKYIGFLIDKIIEEEKIPDEWRKAIVIPIFKGGARGKPENYRPVSLTCIVCKIVEKIFEEYTENELNKNKFYGNNEQHGFRKSYSCDTQLLGFSHDIIQAFKEGKEIVAVFLDYEKAFDKVPHDLLINKAKNLIQDKRIVAVMTDFLDKRTIQVKVNNVLSRDIHATSGVPQGSVWGPRLFNIFIQDLIQVIKSIIRLFADDAVIYRIVETDEDMKILQEDLDRAGDWVNTNKMSLNINKCKSVCFSRKQKKRDVTSLKLQGQDLAEEDQYKYLGVILDDKLDWNQHIAKVVKKSKQTLNFVLRNLKGTNQEVKVMAYKTLVRPNLEYADKVWDPHTQIQKKELEKIQNIMARRVTGNTRRLNIDENGIKTFNNIHVTQLKKDIQLELLEDRRKKSRLTAMYRIVNNHPGWEEFGNKIKKGRYIARKDHSKKLEIIGQTSDFAKFSFMHRTSVEWNKLTEVAVSEPNLKKFKLRI